MALGVLKVKLKDKENNKCYTMFYDGDVVEQDVLLEETFRGGVFLGALLSRGLAVAESVCSNVEILEIEIKNQYDCRYKAYLECGRIVKVETKNARKGACALYVGALLAGGAGAMREVE